MSSNYSFSPFQTPSPQLNPVMSQVYRTAQKLVEVFPDKAVELLVQCDFNMLVRYLQEACDRDQLDFHSVMSSTSGTGSQSLYPRNSQVSQQSRRSTGAAERPTLPYSPPPSSQASSPVLTSPSIQPSSNVIELIHVFDCDDKLKRLNMKSEPQSYSLISEDIVHDRLRLLPEATVHPVSFHYNDALLKASQIVSLTWKGPHSKRTHEALFLLIQSNLLEVDLVVGKLRVEDLIAQAGSPASPSAAQPHRQGSRGVVQPHPQRLGQQGFLDQSIAYSSLQDFADTASPSTVRPTSQRSSVGRSGNVLRESQQPAVSANMRAPSIQQTSRPSQIPRRPNSPARSSGSTSSRVSGRHAHGASSAGASRSQRTSQPKMASIRLLWGESQVTARFNLDASGEDFLQALNLALAPLSVNRREHYVRLSVDKGENVQTFCTVSLLEDELNLEWEEDALPWIESKKETTSRLYATVKQYDGG